MLKRALSIWAWKTNPYVNRIDSLTFMYIKKFCKTIDFCIWMKITMTTISKRQGARFIYTKDKKMTKQFYIQEDRHLAKARKFASPFIYKKLNTLRHAICHEIIWVGIYVQKVWHFWLHDVFIKKSRHFAKSKTIWVTFLYAKKTDTLHFNIFMKIT